MSRLASETPRRIDLVEARLDLDVALLARDRGGAMRVRHQRGSTEVYLRVSPARAVVDGGSRAPDHRDPEEGHIARGDDNGLLSRVRRRLRERNTSGNDADTSSVKAVLVSMRNLGGNSEGRSRQLQTLHRGWEQVFDCIRFSTGALVQCRTRSADPSPPVWLPLRRDPVNLLVRRAMRGDLHDMCLVLSQPGIDAQGVCLRTPVTDRGVVRGRHRVRRVGDDADFVLAHRGGMRDEYVSDDTFANDPGCFSVDIGLSLGRPLGGRCPIQRVRAHGE